MAQDPFVLAVTQLQLDGQTHRQPDKREIEERYPRFYAVPHAGAVDTLQFGAPEVVQLVLKQALPQDRVRLPVHLVATEEFIGTVPAENDFDTATVDPGEEQPGDDSVDDVAVLGEFR